MEYMKRTPLYSINPLGLKSVFIESLTSYIIRLAEVHVVNPRDLLAYEVAPVLNKNYLMNSISRGGNRFYDGAHFLNGFGTNSDDMVNCLIALTGKESVRETTLQRFSGLFGTRYLIRKKLAWCSKCLEKELYYPLIWCLTGYTVCAIHKTSLQEHCVNCLRKIPPLHRKSRIGVCPYCHETHFNSLGSCNKPSGENLYISKDIEKLFFYINSANLNNTNVLNKNLLEIVENNFNGNIAHLARYLGISKTTMWDWCKGEVSPPFNKVLSISYKLGLSSVALYFQTIPIDFKIEYVNSKVQKPIKSRQKHSLSKEYVASYLDDINNKGLNKSINTIARELDCSKKYLYDNFSDYCKRISENNRRNREDKEKERLKKIRLLVHEQFLQEVSKGNLPTRKRIEKELDIPCLFINREMKTYYFDIYSRYHYLLEKELDLFAK